MPVPLFNSIASWFLKKRIHQMELFIKYPIEVQKELLETLLKNARETEIGKLYDFNSIKNYNSFKKHSIKIITIITYNFPLSTRNR